MTAPSPANRAALTMSSDTTTTSDVSLLIARADNQLQSFEKLSFQLSQELLALVSALVAERDGLRETVGRAELLAQAVVDDDGTYLDSNHRGSEYREFYICDKCQAEGEQPDTIVHYDDCQTRLAHEFLDALGNVQSGDETPGGEGTERHNEPS